MVVHQAVGQREDRPRPGRDRQHARLSARERLHGSQEQAQIYLYKGYAFRGFNSHGKALLTLVHNALAGRNEDEYVITEGERLCSTAVGWNFGDGHMHNEQLIAAMQERCDSNRMRCASSCSTRNRSIGSGRNTAWWTWRPGEFERGYVNVADMVTGQPSVRRHTRARRMVR